MSTDPSADDGMASSIKNSKGSHPGGRGKGKKSRPLDPVLLLESMTEKKHTESIVRSLQYDVIISKAADILHLHDIQRQALETTAFDTVAAVMASVRQTRVMYDGLDPVLEKFSQRYYEEKFPTEYVELTAQEQEFIYSGQSAVEEWEKEEQKDALPELPSVQNEPESASKAVNNTLPLAQPLFTLQHTALQEDTMNLQAEIDLLGLDVGFLSTAKPVSNPARTMVIGEMSDIPIVIRGNSINQLSSEVEISVEDFAWLSIEKLNDEFEHLFSDSVVFEDGMQIQIENDLENDDNINQKIKAHQIRSHCNPEDLVFGSFNKQNTIWSQIRAKWDDAEDINDNKKLQNNYSVYNNHVDVDVTAHSLHGKPHSLVEEELAVLDLVIHNKKNTFENTEQMFVYDNQGNVITLPQSGDGSSVQLDVEIPAPEGVNTDQVVVVTGEANSNVKKGLESIRAITEHSDPAAWRAQSFLQSALPVDILVGSVKSRLMNHIVGLEHPGFYQALDESSKINAEFPYPLVTLRDSWLYRKLCGLSKSSYHNPLDMELDLSLGTLGSKWDHTTILEPSLYPRPAGEEPANPYNQSGASSKKRNESVVVSETSEPPLQDNHDDGTPTIVDYIEASCRIHPTELGQFRLLASRFYDIAKLHTRPATKTMLALSPSQVYLCGSTLNPYDSPARYRRIVNFPTPFNMSATDGLQRGSSLSPLPLIGVQPNSQLSSLFPHAFLYCTTLDKATAMPNVNNTAESWTLELEDSQPYMQAQPDNRITLDLQLTNKTKRLFMQEYTNLVTVTDVHGVHLNADSTVTPLCCAKPPLSKQAWLLGSIPSSILQKTREMPSKLTPDTFSRDMLDDGCSIELLPFTYSLQTHGAMGSTVAVDGQSGTRTALIKELPIVPSDVAVVKKSTSKKTGTQLLSSTLMIDMANKAAVNSSEDKKAEDAASANVVVALSGNHIDLRSQPMYQNVAGAAVVSSLNASNPNHIPVVARQNSTTRRDTVGVTPISVDPLISEHEMFERALRDSELRVLLKERKIQAQLSEAQRRLHEEEARVKGYQENLNNRDYYYSREGKVVIKQKLNVDRIPSLTAVPHYNIQKPGVTQPAPQKRGTKSSSTKQQSKADLNVTNIVREDISQPIVRLDATAVQPPLSQTIHPVSMVSFKQGAVIKAGTVPKQETQHATIWSNMTLKEYTQNLVKKTTESDIITVQSTVKKEISKEKDGNKDKDKDVSAKEPIVVENSNSNVIELSAEQDDIVSVSRHNLPSVTSTKNKLRADLTVAASSKSTPTMYAAKTSPNREARVAVPILPPARGAVRNSKHIAAPIPAGVQISVLDQAQLHPPEVQATKLFQYYFQNQPADSI